MRLGLVGFGSIARGLIGLLEKQPVESLAVLVREPAAEAARAALGTCRAAGRCQVVTSTADLLAGHPDLVVECAGAEAVREVVPELLGNGTDVIVVSVGAFADPRTEDAIRAAATGGARVFLPAGAIGGIDLLAALAPAGGLTVSYRGTKPPAAWRGTAAEGEADLNSLSEEFVFFSGNARDAARTFPKNANVAATLALAGAGFETTRVELVADPNAAGNRHEYRVRSPLGRFSVEIENAASGGNVRTSAATAYSVFREINRLREGIVI